MIINTLHLSDLKEFLEMERDFLGRVDKKVTCSVDKCEKPAERSISHELVTKSGLKLKKNKIKKAYLCKEHYKEYKKKSKQDREVQKWRWNA